MNKKQSILSYIINLSFFLYFIILIVERILSVSLSFINGVNIFRDGFTGYVYLLVFLSIVSWLIYLIIMCRDNIKEIFKVNDNISFNHIIIASGILLLSGMVHTEYTIPVIQFISYGILILGILLKVILINISDKNINKISLWLSFVYLVCFSMAIPVMYHSNIKLHILFHILEGITSFLLVVSFTYLFLILFNNRDNLFILIFIIIASILDALLIILRWNEEINWFVLIFISVSLVLFIIGFIYNLIRNKRITK